MIINKGKYIGLAHNKTTATESTTPGDYTWALIKGADGITEMMVNHYGCVL